MKIHKVLSEGGLEIVPFFMNVRSREYRFTHMNCSLVDIPFLSEALSGEIIWVILKVANLNEEGLVIMTGGEGEEGEKVEVSL